MGIKSSVDLIRYSKELRVPKWLTIAGAQSYAVAKPTPRYHFAASIVHLCEFRQVTMLIGVLIYRLDKRLLLSGWLIFRPNVTYEVDYTSVFARFVFGSYRPERI